MMKALQCTRIVLREFLWKIEEGIWFLEELEEKYPIITVIGCAVFVAMWFAAWWLPEYLWLQRGVHE